MSKATAIKPIKIVKPFPSLCVLKDPNNKDYWKAVEHFKLGDCLYSMARFIMPYSPDVVEGYHYTIANSRSMENPIDFLKKIGIDAERMREDGNRYTCPLLDAKLYRSLPVMLFYKEANAQAYGSNYPEWLAKLIFDFDWVSSMVLPEFAADKSSLYASRFHYALLGLGYNYGMGPSDGMGEYHDGIIPLSNGDMLGVKYWIWYNK